MDQAAGSSRATDDEEVQDPAVDKRNPKAIKFNDITSAAYTIKNGIIRTPCERSRLSDLLGIEVYLKKESLQFTGNFKERGARNALAMLSEDKKKKGVVAASSGNHAQAISYHGLQLGIPVTVVMPVIAPLMKVHRCKTLKASVVVQGKDVDESKKVGLKIAKSNGLTYINSYDYPHVLAGQGTVALEVLEQVPDLEAIVVPTGGGGLIAGVGLAMKSMKPNVIVIGVESEKCAAFTASVKAGKPVYVNVESTIADGLAVPLIGYNAFETAKPHVDKMAVVKEASIALAILRLVENEKSVVEGAGAVTLAAGLEGQLDELQGKKAVLVVSGGNIDTTILGRCLERGLAADGRLIKVTVCVSDRPGGVAELIKLIASIKVNIKDIFHERAWISHDIFSVDVTCICETTDGEHAQQLRKLLKKSYKRVLMEDGQTCHDRSIC